MAESSEFIPFQHTGVFSIGTHMPGAPSLQAVLSIPAHSSMVSGHGVLTQATNPPLHSNNAFHGVVHVLVFGANVTQVYALQGSAIPPLFGASHVTQLAISLEGLWGKKGTASYAYVTGSVFHHVNDVPVAVNWLLQA